MQFLSITGRVGGDAETRRAGDSDVTNFNVAVDQGWGDSKQTNWFRCAVWGARGGKLQPYIKKGDKVAVTGELVIGEYQGKPQFEIRAADVDCFMVPKQDTGGHERRTTEPAASRFDAELDEDVPF